MILKASSKKYTTPKSLPGFVNVEQSSFQGERINAFTVYIDVSAPQLKLSDDRLSVTGEKGYCMLRATHGMLYSYY